MGHLVVAATLLSALLSQAEATDPQAGLVFSDAMQGDVAARWTANSCELSRETKISGPDGSSLRLVDRGPNAQAYLLLSTQAGRKYEVRALGYRPRGNKGDWFGKIAVSIAGGGTSSGHYLASSGFIARPDCWETLRFSFEAPSDRA